MLQPAKTAAEVACRLLFTKNSMSVDRIAYELVALSVYQRYSE